VAEICGKTASVSMGGTVIAGIRDWSIDYTGDALETTDFADSGHRTYIAGLDGWTGSFNGFGQPSWSTSAVVGTKYAGKFYIEKVGAQFYSGSVLITETALGNAVDGLATTDYTFTGSGALTLVDS